MKSFLIFFFFTISLLNASEIIIQSLKVYNSSSTTSFPLIINSDKLNQSISIEFDVKTELSPNLSIIFKFSDKNWTPYENIFLQNNGFNTEYNLDLQTLPQTITGADYYFKDTFPNNNVSFPFSGKYVFFIIESGNENTILASGKFFNLTNPIKLQTTLNKEQLEDQVYFPSDLARIFNITSSFLLPDDFFPGYVDRIEIIENQKLNFPFIINRELFSDVRNYSWNGSNNFSFSARDIRPGNEYRQIDLRNASIYQGPDASSFKERIEVSRFFKKSGADLNGASILSDPFNAYSDYLNITFSLRLDTNPEEVFITGSFNDWQVTKAYLMNKNDDLYTITLRIKRGIYDYQYVTGNSVNSDIATEIDWVNIEGNFWETKNIYNIFLYYTDPEYGGYDRIIGYSFIESNKK